MDTSAHSVHEPAVTGRGRWHPRTRARRAMSTAFSLIEVAVALGIVGFAFVAILGLVPVALTTFRTSKTGAVSSQISQQIIAQAQVAPFTALTQTNSTAQTATSQGVTYTVLRLPGPPETPGGAPLYVRYFNDQGVEVLSTDATGIYQVNSRVLVGPPFTQPAGSAGTGNASVASLTVQVAYNPGRLTLDLDNTTDLWKGTAGGGSVAVPILSFPTNVARNF